MNKVQMLLACLTLLVGLSAQDNLPAAPDSDSIPATTEKPASTAAPTAAPAPIAAPATAPAPPSTTAPAVGDSPVTPATNTTKDQTETKPPVGVVAPSDALEKKNTPEMEAQKPVLPDSGQVEKKVPDDQAPQTAEATKVVAPIAKIDEQTFWTKLLTNSKFYTGVTGGLGISTNSVHSTGYELGMTVDYMAYQRYGFHFGAETGSYGAKANQFTSGNNTLSLLSDGTLGFLSFDLELLYGLPKFLKLEPAVGLGAALYQLRGGSYQFNQTLAPRIMVSLYYNLLPQLQMGLIWNLTLASASKLTSSGTDYPLNDSVGISVMGLQLSLRYAWF